MSERDELVENLRYAHEHRQQRVLGSRIFKDAADQIERDRQEIERLREALTRIDDIASDQNCDRLYPHNAEGWEAALDDVQIVARAALNRENDHD